MPTITGFTGYEHGINTPAEWSKGLHGNVFLGSGNWSIVGAAARSGNFGLRSTNPTGTGWVMESFSSQRVVLTGHLRTSVLQNNMRLALIESTGDVNNIQFQYDTVNNRFFLNITGTGGVTVNGSSSISLNQWVRVEFDVNATANPWVVKWKVNGVDQTQAGPGIAATTFIAAGPSVADTFTGTVDYDDWAVSLTGADYPLGEKKALLYPVDGVATHNLETTPSACFFKHDNTTQTALTSSETTSHQMIDEVPVATGTPDRLLVTGTPGATRYVEHSFANTAETNPPDAVKPIHTIRNDSGVTANSITGKVAYSGSESAIYSAFSIASASNLYKQAILATAPGGVAWTAAILNALTNRWGYTNSTASTPRLENAVVEVLFPPTTAGGGSTSWGAHSGFGIAHGGSIQFVSATERNREMLETKGINCAWSRFSCSWFQVANGGSNPANYQWGATDTTVAAAQAQGLEVLLVIMETPPWARAAGTDDKYPPTNLQDYATFAQQVVQRYRPLGVRCYEVWNEANINGFWKPVPDPERYTDMLKLAYPLMKAAGADVVVTQGSSPASNYNGAPGNPGDAIINGVRFLERIYARGGKGFFDAVAHHPYPGNGLPSAATDFGWGNMNVSSPSLRSVMVANGDGNKELWATEFGVSTAAPDNVTQQRQADIIGDGIAVWKAQTFPRGPLFIYALESQTLDGYDVFNSDFSEKIAAGVIRAGAAGFGSGTPATGAITGNIRVEGGAHVFPGGSVQLAGILGTTTVLGGAHVFANGVVTRQSPAPVPGAPPVQYGVRSIRGLQRRRGLR